MADAAGFHSDSVVKHTGRVSNFGFLQGHSVEPTVVDGDTAKVNSSRQVLLFIVTYVIRQVFFLSLFDDVSF